MWVAFDVCHMEFDATDAAKSRHCNVVDIPRDGVHTLTHSYCSTCQQSRQGCHACCCRAQNGLFLKGLIWIDRTLIS